MRDRFDIWRQRRPVIEALLNAGRTPKEIAVFYKHCPARIEEIIRLLDIEVKLLPKPKEINPLNPVLRTYREGKATVIVYRPYASGLTPEFWMADE